MTNVMAAHSYSGEFKSAINRAKKILVAAGFPWSITSGKYQPFFNKQVTSTGMRVSRIGCSETISVHVYGMDFFSKDRETRRFIEAWAIATLREAGMPFDDRGWLACGKDARRAQGVK